jgi:hypothetical protein
VNESPGGRRQLWIHISRAGGILTAICLGIIMDHYGGRLFTTVNMRDKGSRPPCAYGTEVEV